MIKNFKRLHEYFVFRQKAIIPKSEKIQSAYVAILLKSLFSNDEQLDIFKPIESERSVFNRSNELMHDLDYGAGSIQKNKRRTLGMIAKISSASPRKCRFLYRLVNYIQPSTIIELGTSVGISVAYMSLATKLSNIYTIEGNQQRFQQAIILFNKLNLNNIQAINGLFDDHLPDLLRNSKKLFVYVDGNHTYEATTRYFNDIARVADNDTLIVFDDIRWSSEMKRAWEFIINDKRVQTSIDLFTVGIVFFRKTNEKEHFKIKYLL